MSLLYPQTVNELLSRLASLPGIGRRSAERIAIHLLAGVKQQDACAELARACHDASTKVNLCQDCGFFSEGDLCEICRKSERQRDLLCVIENISELVAIESAAVFDGYYHCLGGKLSPIKSIAPEDLRIERLLERTVEIARKHGRLEVIFALSSDIEGESTINYLIDTIQKKLATENLPSARCSRLASGLAVGENPAIADSATLGKAIEGRIGA